MLTHTRCDFIRNLVGIDDAGEVVVLELAHVLSLNVQVVPIRVAIEESLDLAHEIYNRVFRKVPERLIEKKQ
jgi:hypothetical protein